MKAMKIVRALKDKQFRDSLSNAQQAAVGANPAGIAELDENLLKAVSGGIGSLFGTGCGTGTMPGSHCCVK